MPLSDAWMDGLAGWCSGAVSVLCLQPVDTILTRWQAASPVVASATATTTNSRSAAAAASTVLSSTTKPLSTVSLSSASPSSSSLTAWSASSSSSTSSFSALSMARSYYHHTHSIRSFWRGAVPMITAVPFQNALLMGGYGVGVQFSESYAPNSRLGSIFIGGLCGGLLQSFLMSPVELLKVAQQCQHKTIPNFFKEQHIFPIIFETANSHTAAAAATTVAAAATVTKTTTTTMPVSAASATTSRPHPSLLSSSSFPATTSASQPQQLLQQPIVSSTTTTATTMPGTTTTTAATSGRVGTSHPSLSSVRRIALPSSALWHGLGATLLRDGIPHGVWFVAYEVCKQELTEWNQKTKKNSHSTTTTTTKDSSSSSSTTTFEVFGVPMVSGAVAATVAWAVGYPADVIKTRIQNAAAAAAGSSSTSISTTPLSIWNTTQQLIQEANGNVIRGLYRGFGLKLVRSVPASMIGFTVYEWVKHTILLKV